MEKGKSRPIPRVDPPEEEPDASGRTTERPPAEPSQFTVEGKESPSASYKMLRDSCRTKNASDDTVHDDELAVEAEVLRVALDRKSGRPKR